MSTLIKWDCVKRGLLYVFTTSYLSLSGASCAQEPVIDPISSHNHAINSIEADQGGYASDLSDLYLGLGRALIDQKDFAKAKRAFEQGMQIERVNNGLGSLSQSPYLLLLANTEGLLGNWKQARSALSNLYQINRQVYGAEDLRMLPILDQLLDWFLTTYQQRTVNGGYENLVIAERIGESIETILPKDADLEQASARYQRLAYLHYMIADHLRLHGDAAISGATFSTGVTAGSHHLTTSHLHFQRGKYALEKVVETLVAQEKNNAQQQAIAIAQLGDWHLIFGQKQAAKQAYKLASDALKIAKSSQALHLELFDKPRIIQFNAYNRPKSQHSESRLEVGMRVSAVGKLSEIQVVASPHPLTKKQLSNLKRNLRHTKLRPRLVAGETVASLHREIFPLSILEK